VLQVLQYFLLATLKYSYWFIDLSYQNYQQTKGSSSWSSNKQTNKLKKKL